jgi:NADH dehydrogenase
LLLGAAGSQDRGAMTTHVVIVGAGFGGLTAAKALRGAPVRVTLVDQHNFHTFQPLLYQVATAGLGSEDIAHSVRGIFHDQANVAFALGRVAGVDPVARTVLLADGPAVPYDFLVLAAGAVTNTFGVPGVAEHALALKGLDEALAVRNHVLRQFELADRDPAVAAAGGLTVVVIGGGPTGVELAGALTELFDTVLARDFPRLDMAHARVVLVEATDRLLGPFSAASGSYALHKLRAMGVDVRLGAQVSEITAEGVCLADGSVIATRSPIWVAGVRAHPLAEAAPFEQTRGGRIAVGPDLTVPGHPDVFVIGDLAGAAASGSRPELLPQLAPVAIQQGRFVAREIQRRLEGRRPGAFRYVDKGTMATIGRNAAVAELPLRVRFRGFPAWVAWLFLHLLYLVGFRNRLRVLLDWGWNYLTYDRGARVIVGPAYPTADKVDVEAGGLSSVDAGAQSASPAAESTSGSTR